MCEIDTADFSPYERFVEARMERTDTQARAREYERLTKVMWSATRDAIEQTRAGISLDPEIAQWIFGMMGDIATARPSTEAACIVRIQKQRRGAPAYDERLIECERYAVALVAAVERHCFKGLQQSEFRDTAGTKRWLAERYGCNIETVRNWCRDGKLANATLTEFPRIRRSYNAFVEHVQNNLDGNTEEIRDELIRRAIEETTKYGKIYGKISRSAGANIFKSSKRQY
jgi:hypothetical protein